MILGYWLCALRSRLQNGGAARWKSRRRTLPKWLSFVKPRFLSLLTTRSASFGRRMRRARLIRMRPVPAWYGEVLEQRVLLSATITVVGGTTLNYNTQSPAGVIDAGLTLSDTSGNVAGGTVAITGNFAGTQDVLSFTNTANITGSYNTSTGVLSLSGTDTLAHYQTALRSVKYQDTGSNPSTMLRTVG